MIDNILASSVVEWSRLQFALTAIFHWFFVPLTLGLSFMIAIMETIYVKTGNEFWKKMTKFWMTIFGVNFAIGVATGIILEFEFGTNWSNYSWFVGDIFGAPLAIEGILAFFMESTFIAIMFFGWNKVSKKVHLASSWLTAFGANISALWILVANGWMQYPAGMKFNPDTARNEMANFWDVLFSPVAINKFFHTVTSAYVLAAIVVIGISAWFLLKNREKTFAKKSIVIAGVFGLLSSAALLWTGDGSAYQVSQKQPMKLAAMEGLYEGKEGAGLSVIGMLTPGKEYNYGKENFVFNLQIPKLLSFLGYRDFNAYVPGINNLIEGGYEYIDKNGKKQTAISAQEKINRGKKSNIALAEYTALKEYQRAKRAGDASATAKAKQQFEEKALKPLEEEKIEQYKEDARQRLEADFDYFGYGYLDKPEDIIPHVPITFYSFRIMVGLGVFFILVFIVALWGVFKQNLENKRWMLYVFICSIPLVYIASQCGWAVAELGRQPWTIQDLMPTNAAVSRIDAGAVITTFFLFFALFTVLLIAELKILFTQVKKGPKIEQE